MKHLALSLLLSASFALAQPTRPSVEDRLWNDLTSTLGAFEFKCPDDGYSDAITLCAAYRGDHAFLSNVVNLIEPTYGVGKGSFAEMTPWQPWGEGAMVKNFRYVNEYGLAREMDIIHDLEGEYILVMFANMLY